MSVHAHILDSRRLQGHLLYSIGKPGLLGQVESGVHDDHPVVCVHVNHGKIMHQPGLHPGGQEQVVQDFLGPWCGFELFQLSGFADQVHYIINTKLVDMKHQVVKTGIPGVHSEEVETPSI